MSRAKIDGGGAMNCRICNGSGSIRDNYSITGFRACFCTMGHNLHDETEEEVGRLADGIILTPELMLDVLKCRIDAKTTEKG